MRMRFWNGIGELTNNCFVILINYLNVKWTAIKHFIVQADAFNFKI